MYVHTYSDLSAVPPKRMWQLLRTLRHTPPGRAGRGARRETFDAAMEQAEQLFIAAQSIGTATRPLLTFYGVAQLGRAIAAVSTSLDNKEYRLSSHGLADGSLSVAASNGLSEVTIRGLPTGAFPVVAKALGASTMRQNVSIGQLWNLLPDAERFPLRGLAGRKALSVESSFLTPDKLHCEVGGVPLDALGGRDAVMELARLISLPSVDPPVIAVQHEQLRVFFADYPGLSDASLGHSGPLQPIHFKFGDRGEALRVPVSFPQATGESMAVTLSRRAHLYHGASWAYPSLDSDGRPAHPFMLWWAVLYVLSRLARYEPRDWTRLISVSSSPDATAVEYLLDEAQAALPELAYAAIEQVGAE
jgi:hypothetical protein